MPERESPGPRPQTSRRAPSFTQLQTATAAPATVHAHTNGSTKPVQPEIQDEAQMNNLRHSLLQHIQSVQREIARLQLERRRTQQGTAEHADLPSSSPKAVPVGASPMMAMSAASANAMAIPVQAARPQQPPLC